MVAVIATVEDLSGLSHQILSALRARPSGGRARVLALIGELGAGKTTFTQTLGEGLGLRRQVLQSPTFVLRKDYRLPAVAPWRRLIHLDCYRLEAAELRHLAWAEILNEPGNLVVVEWADKILASLPSVYYQIVFTVLDEHRRSLDWGWVEK